MKMKKKSSKEGRRKMEMKKVEENNKRHVTFSKRKLGLFNKVTELSILCQAETALIIASQNGKLFSCGYPNPDTVLARFLTGATSSSQPPPAVDNHSLETFRTQYEAAQETLKQQKMLRDALEATMAVMGYFPSWWLNSIDDMPLEELLQFKSSLEQLKMNLMATMEVKPSTLVLPMQQYSNFPSVSSNATATTQQHPHAWDWDWRNNAIASTSTSGTWDNNWTNNAVANTANTSCFHPNVYFPN